MCLTVDQTGNGQDVVITGSKDHNIRVSPLGGEGSTKLNY